MPSDLDRKFDEAFAVITGPGGRARAAPRGVQDPQRMIFSQTPLPRLSTGKIDRVALKAKHTA